MTELARAEVVIGGNDTDLQNTLARSARSMQQTGAKMQRIGRRMAATVTAPLVAAGAAALKMSSDFERSMTKIQTLVGLSEESVADMRREILDLAPALGKTPQELSRALFAITSGGLRGAEAMRVLEQSAKASAIGLGDVEQIGRTATAALQAFGDTGLTAEKAIDVLVATVRTGNLEAEELAGSLGRVMGIADAAGIPFEQMNAFIATFTRLGTSAEEAATALRATLSSLIKPTTEQREAFRQVGTSVREFRQEIQERGLAVALTDLIASSEGNVEVLGQLIPNVRALAGVLGTAGSQGEAFQEVQREITESLGTTNEGFEDIQDTTAQTFNELKAQGAALAITWGDELAPTFSAFLGVVDDMVEVFTSLPKPMRQAITIMGALAAAIAPVVFAAGTLTKAFGGIATAVRGLSAAVVGLHAAMGPTGWLVLGATALTGIAVKKTLDGWAEGGAEARAQLDGLTDSLDGLVEKSRELSRGQISQVISSVSLQALTIERQIRDVQSRLAELRETPPAMRARRGVTEMIKKRESELAALQRQLQETQTTLGELREMGEAAGRSFDLATGGGAGAGTPGGATGVGTPAPTRPTVVDAFLRSFGVPSVDELMSAVQRRFNVLSDRLDPSKQTGFQGFGDFQATGAAAMEFGGFSGELTGQEDFSKIGEAFGAGVEKASKAAEKHLDIWKRIGQAVSIELSNALTDLLTGVEDIGEGLKGLFMSILDTVQRIVTRIAVNQFLQSVGLSFAGGFATGGTIPSGSFGVVGERGPELVTGPAKVVPMEGGSNREIHIHEAPTEIKIAAVDAASFKEFADRNADVFAAATAKGARKSTGIRHAILAGR